MMRAEAFAGICARVAAGEVDSYDARALVRDLQAAHKVLAQIGAVIQDLEVRREMTDETSLIQRAVEEFKNS